MGSLQELEKARGTCVLRSDFQLKAPKVSGEIGLIPSVSRAQSYLRDGFSRDRLIRRISGTNKSSRPVVNE